MEEETEEENSEEIMIKLQVRNNKDPTPGGQQQD